VAALAVSLLGGVGGTLALLRYSFARNSQALAVESVRGAQKLFQILEARETSKMLAVGDAVMMNPEVRDAFAAKDRKRLLEVAGPLYEKLKAEHITNFFFQTPEPSMNVFLRLTNPPKFGDSLNRFMDKEVARTHTVVAGNALAHSGFAARVERPFYDSRGILTGYMEFGEEISQFIQEMKNQTGDNYGLLLSKKFMDRQAWADSVAVWKRRDNWDDHSNFVVAENTTASDNIIQYQGDLASIPKDGKVLDRFKGGDSVFVRGIFPIYDSARNTVGAMFVVRDISGVYNSMRNTQSLIILVSAAVQLCLTVLLLTLLNSLVFRRLGHIVAVVTRVVGGDYKTEIRAGSNDEIGQFERLFEQFRSIFVDVLALVPEFQEKK
jgi:HAMP domain-containing protein